jgi:hypothetical protein
MDCSHLGRASARRSLHLLHMLLIQNLLHGQELDDSTRSLDFGELSRVVERGAFLLGVFGVAGS